jgi:hypothetical protein
LPSGDSADRAASAAPAVSTQPVAGRSDYETPWRGAPNLPGTTPDRSTCPWTSCPAHRFEARCNAQAAGAMSSNADGMNPSDPASISPFKSLSEGRARRNGLMGSSRGPFTTPHRSWQPAIQCPTFQRFVGRSSSFDVCSCSFVRFIAPTRIIIPDDGDDLDARTGDPLTVATASDRRMLAMRDRNRPDPGRGDTGGDRPAESARTAAYVLLERLPSSSISSSEAGTYHPGIHRHVLIPVCWCYRITPHARSACSSLDG